MNFYKSQKEILIFLFSIAILFSPIFLTNSYSQNTEKNNFSCNCVVFRLDDIQDSFVNKSQLAIMNLFLEKNQKVALALILNFLENDTSIINKIRTGYETGNFELASHGWNHENFSQIGEQNQIELLNKANEKIFTLFGDNSTIFIPPFYDYNNSTLNAIRQSGIRIFSSFDIFYQDKGQSDLITYGAPQDDTDSRKIFHFPTTIEYSRFKLDKWITIPVEQVIPKIDKSISTYGYAVITLHPQAFAPTENGTSINSVNKTQLNNLGHLLDSIIDHKIRITTFHDLSGIDKAVKTQDK